MKVAAIDIGSNSIRLIVAEVTPDGSDYRVRVPLTRLDVLHPELGDVIVESSLHDQIRRHEPV